MQKDYSKTLNLPETSFSMKANLIQKESNFLKFWDELNIYERSIEKREKEFHFHDGPPYANGSIHIGTALNKILKDIFLKYKRLNGYRASFIPGWDSHGLPIELKVLSKNLKDPIQIRKACKSYALKQVEIQKKEFKTLGILADWHNHYVTLTENFVSKQLDMFSSFVKKGYIFYELKPIYWSWGCETALAEAEIEYKDKESYSIYVKFKVHFENIKNLSIVIWTTTPWTLPANVAIAVNPIAEYSIIQIEEEYLIIAKDLLDKFLNEVNYKSYKFIHNVKGKELEFLKAEHPFLKRESIIILGDFVSLDTGTGAVHIAPGHGQEDYILGKKYNLDTLSIVDEKGNINLEGEFNGKFYEDINEDILQKLKSNLIKSSKIIHSYPHCWRSKTPIVFRATKQCFIKMDLLKEDCIKALKDVEFYPKVSSNRINSMIEKRPDWCISRQRIWGVPIPVILNKETKEPLLDIKIIDKIVNLIKDKGIEYYLSNDLGNILDIENVKNYEKSKDIMDVWLDSGSVHYAAYNGSISEFYLEGTDQHRGWFQTSLITSVAQKSIAPYKKLITHGFVVDSNGIKMSKSLNNTVSPLDVIKENGADILRLWVSSVDYSSDVKISKDIIKTVSENYRKIRNSIRFILGNLKDFKIENALNIEELNEIDKLAMSRLYNFMQNSKIYYENYELEKVYNNLLYFLSTEMSAFYFDILKDRLYTLKSENKSRLSAQTVLYNIVINVVKILAPILSFTAEEIWQDLLSNNLVKEESIFLSNITNINIDKIDLWDDINLIRDLVNKKIENLIFDKVINTSSESIITFKTENKNFLNIFRQYSMEELLKVASFNFIESGNDIIIEKFSGIKCLRCWKYFMNLKEEVCDLCSSILRTE